VPLRTRWINIRLTLENDDYKVYEAVVETAKGSEIRRIGGLKSQLSGGNKVVDLRISSCLIQAGDYIVKLSGILGGNKGNEEDMEEYGFRTVNR